MTVRPRPSSLAPANSTVSTALLTAALVVSLSSTASASPPAGKAAAGPLSLHLGDRVELVPRLQFRPRFLAHEGKTFRDANTNTTLSQRVRLGVEARFFGWMSAYIEVQDVRTWGEETNTLSDVSADGFDLHQGWAALTCPLGLTLKVGRQEINFDNQRLIGAVGWSTQGRSLDAIKLSYRRPWGMEADLFFALVAEEDVPGGAAADDTYLGAARARYTGIAAVRPSVVGIWDNVGSLNRQRGTVGVYVDGNPLKGLKYSAEFYYQFGSQEVTGAEDLSIAALLAAVRVGYVAQIPTLPGLTVWFDYLSGDDDANDGTNRAFDTLYATNHKFYGFMDYFLNVPVHTENRGIMDMGGRAQVAPLAGLLLFVDYHHFELAQKDAYGAATLGNEVDILARYRINAHLTLEGVFGVFVPKQGAGWVRRDRTTGAWGKQTETFGYLQMDLKI